MARKDQKGFTIVELIASLGILVWLALVIGVVWAVWHFVAKFW